MHHKRVVDQLGDGGEPTDVTDIIEHVDVAGNFTVFRGGERIVAGHHVDLTVDPDGFTNVPVAADPDLQIARELAIYRFSGDVLEVCKVKPPAPPCSAAVGGVSRLEAA